jgi:hypothetical protein
MPAPPKAEPIGPPKDGKGDGKKMPEGAAIMPVTPDAKPVINSEVPF